MQVTLQHCKSASLAREKAVWPEHDDTLHGPSFLAQKTVKRKSCSALFGCIAKRFDWGLGARAIDRQWSWPYMAFVAAASLRHSLRSESVRDHRVLLWTSHIARDSVFGASS